MLDPQNLLTQDIGHSLRGFIETYGTALAGLAVFLFFVAFAPNFSNPANLLNILKQVSFLAKAYP